MGEFTGHLFNALTLGAIYALIAVGYTMVYGIIKLINFAHGEMFMFGTFFGLMLISNLGFHFGWALLLAMIGCGMVGALLDWSAYLPMRRSSLLPDSLSIAGLLLIVVLAIIFFSTRPDAEAPRPEVHKFCGVMLLILPCLMVLMSLLENAGLIRQGATFETERLSALITAIGMSLSFQTVAQLIWGARYRAFPESGLPKFFNAKILTLWSAQLTGKEVAVWVAAIVLMIGLNVLVFHTKIGRAMRACAQDKTTASLMGVNVNAVIAFTFMVGSAMAAVAGILYAIKVGGNINYRMGYYPGVIAFAAAVLGGIGNIKGALVGGVLLGFTQAFGQGYIASEYGIAYGFLVMIIVILFRPWGLYGQQEATRA